MAIAVLQPRSAASRRHHRRVSLAVLALMLSGCSINLGSLTPDPEPAKLASSGNIAALNEAIKNSPNDPQAYNQRGSALASSSSIAAASATLSNCFTATSALGALATHACR